MECFGMAVLGSWVGRAATWKNNFAGEARIYGGARDYLWRRLKPTLLERTSGHWEPRIGGGAVVALAQALRSSG